MASVEATRFDAGGIDVAAAAITALGEDALQLGFGLMAIAAASDTAFALADGGGPLAAVEGAVMTGVALSGLFWPTTAARLLRPRGAALILAALFAAAGALDWGVQSHFAEVAPAIVWIAVIVSSPPWLVACVAVSGLGYMGDLLLKGHSLAWTVTPRGRELIGNQWIDLIANAGVVWVLVTLLRRFIAGIPSNLADARRGGPAITRALSAAVSTEPVALAPGAQPATRVASLTEAEHRVLRLLRAGLLPKQAAIELDVALPTVRSHIAAAKRKTGARTLEQLVGIYAQATDAI